MGISKRMDDSTSVADGPNVTLHLAAACLYKVQLEVRKNRVPTSPRGVDDSGLWHVFRASVLSQNGIIEWGLGVFVVPSISQDPTQHLEMVSN